MRLSKPLFALCMALFFSLVSSVSAAENIVAPVTPEYRIGNGDELNFRFIYVPEFNTVVSVRSDGRISLPLIGEISVDGLTLAELTKQVEQLMSTQLRRPQVTVNLQGTGSQRVFIGGEVMRPGVQPLIGPLTVLQAVTIAEGLKDTSQPRQTIILRRGPNGTRTVLSVNLDSLMSGEDLSQDMQLQASDVVVVPRSGIANVDRWIDQYIRRVLPFNMGANYTYSKNGVIQ